MEIIKNVEEIKKISTIKAYENEIFFEKFRDLDDCVKKSFDIPVKRFYEDLKKILECRECGNCCREVIIVFEKDDIPILSQGTGIDEKELIEKTFIFYEKHNVFVMNQSPCKYLKGNECSVYPFRGTECREFPYIETKDFSKIYNYVFQGYSICPFHFNIVEFIKNLLVDNIKTN
ncbi:MAG: YkgJ family cysteine cluster protein [candidate division WOR-3 bacterium]